MYGSPAIAFGLGDDKVDLVGGLGNEGVGDGTRKLGQSWTQARRYRRHRMVHLLNDTARYECVAKRRVTLRATHRILLCDLSSVDRINPTFG